jgi:hypothetical protein
MARVMIIRLSAAHPMPSGQRVVSSCSLYYYIIPEGEMSIGQILNFDFRKSLIWMGCIKEKTTWGLGKTLNDV